LTSGGFRIVSDTLI